ncbi:Tigger transposable element-derived protein 4 [Thelohanellus kitauei]|uniref:Tigger transposable element-derived protein 4 n=1 Tax=Thelohanellus kitauei TaxID=669202 RepID=A0A0C2MRV4_THEKT|nr:Tigger transposable element-derived protein 4 [Thelohanellus kitauei]
MHTQKTTTQGRRCSRSTPLVLKCHELPVVNQWSLLKEKVKQLAQDLNVRDFDSNNGSLERWKERNNIKFKKLNGEKQDAFYFGAESWIRDAPPAVIKDYEAKDIFNPDETGLYSPAMPEETLSFKNSETAACKMA